MKATQTYVLRRGLEEMARLRMQAAALTADTEILLDRIGVCPVWLCLDVACGLGGITDVLSRVGPAGRVVGSTTTPRSSQPPANGRATVPGGGRG